MFSVAADEYSIFLHYGPMPEMYGEYRRHATFIHEHELASPDGELFFIAVGTSLKWPRLLLLAAR